MNGNNGIEGIYVEAFALQRSTISGIPGAIILLYKSSAALHQFVANLHNTGAKLEQILSGCIHIHSDGRARLAIPNHNNGPGNFEYINLDSHEARVLAMKLQQIGLDNLLNLNSAYNEEAQNRLQEFVALYT